MPPPLTTARLTLVPWSVATEAHKDGLVAAWDDPEVWKYVGAGRDAFTRADLDRGYARAGQLGLLDRELIVVRTVDEAVLGVCGLYPSWFDEGDPDETDLGYRYGRAAWGQGYGYEAAAEVMRWAVEERGLDRVGSNVQVQNIASHKILQRLGFTFVDTRPVPSDPARTAHWYVWVAPRCEAR
jgi:RimJ/RimL family protein N-acetyltransferase